MTKGIYVAIVGLFALGCGESSRIETISEKEAVASDSITVDAELTITPIEHASAVLNWGESTIYIDPVGGASAYEGQKSPDFLLITDIHGDHFSIETLDSMDLSKAKIIVPQAVADQLPSKYFSQIHILKNGDIQDFNGIEIEAVPMYNLREEAAQFHTKGRGNGYILSKGNERVYFSGDTEDIPEMRSLTNIDKAFICMNLPYTMTVESAASAVLAFKPKQVYPYHYRGKLGLSDVAKFKKLVNEGDPTIEVIQLDWYPKNED